MEYSGYEYELSNHLNTFVNSYTPVRVFCGQAYFVFSQTFLRKIPQLPAFLKSLVLRGYERGSHHPLSRLRKEVKP